MYRWTAGEGSTKDDMIIMENLVPQGFVPLKQEKKVSSLYSPDSIKKFIFIFSCKQSSDHLADNEKNRIYILYAPLVLQWSRY